MDIREQSETLTVERFDRTQDRVVRDFGYGDTVGAMGVAKDNLRKLSVAIALKLTEAKTLKENSPKRDFYSVISNLDPDVLALSVLTTCLHVVAIGTSRIRALQMLGHAIAGECWANGLLVSNTKLAKAIERASKERHGNLKYRKQAARSIASRAGYKQKHWSPAQIVQAGSWALDMALETLPGVFAMVETDEGDPVLTITPEALEVAEAAVEQSIRGNPVFLPALTPPEPWTGWRTGGYWDERSRLNTEVVRTIYKETAASVRGALRDGTMAAHVAALNAAQSVAFKVNKPILDVIRECYDRGIPVEGLPSKMNLPELKRSADWADKPDDAKRAWKHEAAQIIERNRTMIGTRLMFAQDCETADRLSEAERFYVPLNCDWRGRVYGVSHFNFQRDDRVRALFLFADGEPLGDEGLRWLKIHTANCGDFDKISKQPFDARVAWIDANLERIIECTNHPLLPSSVSFWTEADKPFLFLASCMELAAAVKSPSPKSFITHLPVSFDGSCSGLQHLCAMTRAPEGKLVNLTPGELPQDVYQTVADAVKLKIEADVLNGREVNSTEVVDGKSRKVARIVRDDLPALCLKFGISRKVVKRNVMTFSYSSKKYGMAKQQDEDLIDKLSFDVLSGKLPEHPFGPFAKKAHPKAASPAATYLAEKIYTSIQEVVDGPERAMQMLRKIALALAHEGKSVNWTTPTGLPWANRYFVPNVKRVQLWMHDTRVQISVADGATKTVDKERAANGVAPNFVHALDASHLALTVNAAVAEGIGNIATVHDSFGCLAPRATRFNQIIREQFVKMYEDHDVLNEVLSQATCALTLHNQQRLPEGLHYGTLDLRQVLGAPYAFA